MRATEFQPLGEDLSLKLRALERSAAIARAITTLADVDPLELAKLFKQVSETALDETLADLTRANMILSRLRLVVESEMTYRRMDGVKKNDKLVRERQKFSFGSAETVEKP